MNTFPPMEAKGVKRKMEKEPLMFSSEMEKEPVMFSSEKRPRHE